MSINMFSTKKLDLFEIMKRELEANFDQMNCTLNQLLSLLIITDDTDFFDTEPLTLRYYFSIAENLTKDAVLISNNIRHYINRDVNQIMKEE